MKACFGRISGFC